MKKFNLLLFLFSLSFIISCSVDSNEETLTTTKNNSFSKGIRAQKNCTLTTNSDCGLANSSITFNFIPNPSSANVLWTIDSGDITALLGNGTSQVFYIGSSFTGGQISATGGSFGCKDTYYIPPCIVSNCSISGPNCGTSGDTLSFNFYGASSGQYVSWSYSGSGITNTGGQGTSSAMFSLSNAFNGGTITASILGCSVTVPLPDCCQSSRMTIDNNNVLKME